MTEVQDRLHVEAARTVIWRQVIDADARLVAIVAKRCACPGVRIPGMDADFCPACRTYWVDETPQLLDVRLVFHRDDAPPSAVYIGRQKTGMHYGNPFSHLQRSVAAVKVATLAESIACCEAWLLGTKYQDVEPERRDWILENLEPLRDRPLSCHCAPRGGVNLTFDDCCHGQVYLRWLEARKTASQQKPARIAAKPKRSRQKQQPEATLALETAEKRSPPAAASKPTTAASTSVSVSEAATFAMQTSLFPELETSLPRPSKPYELQPGAWHLPNFLDRTEQQDLVEWLRWRCGKRLRALKTPSGLDFSVKVASIGRQWVPYEYADPDDEDETLDFKLEAFGRSALNAVKLGLCPEFRPDTAILNYYAPTAKLSMHQDDSEAAALIAVGSPIITISLGMSCRARQGNPTDKNQPYQDFEFRSGDAWVMHGPSRRAFHGVMRLLPDTHPPWLTMSAPGRLSVSIRQSKT